MSKAEQFFFVYGTFFGIVLATCMPGAFSRPWFQKGIYVGDSVAHKPENDYAFYSFCKKGKVIYKETSESIVVRWSECETMGDRIMFETHREDQLRLR